MTTTIATKPEANEHGVTWAPSKSGRFQIACVSASRRDLDRGPGWEVWAIRTGTHDIDYAQAFPNEAEARKHANWLWRTR